VIDWPTLHAAAADAAARSYSPYSNFPVGAAALVDDGRVISGCNIENASYGLTLCAECSLISALHMGGGGRLLAVVTCTLDPQLLWEHGGAECLLNGDGRVQPMRDVLPGAFDGSELSP
jgi:cytidine deaminase